MNKPKTLDELTSEVTIKTENWTSLWNSGGLLQAVQVPIFLGAQDRADLRAK